MSRDVLGEIEERAAKDWSPEVNVYICISEEVCLYGGSYDPPEPPEYGSIMAIVAAKSNAQAKYLAWKSDRRNFTGDFHDMPRFSTKKLGELTLEPKARVLDYPSETDAWWALVPDDWPVPLPLRSTDREVLHGRDGRGRLPVLYGSPRQDRGGVQAVHPRERRRKAVVGPSPAKSVDGLGLHERRMQESRRRQVSRLHRVHGRSVRVGAPRDTRGRTLTILDPKTQLPAYLTPWLNALKVWVQTPEIRRVLTHEGLLSQLEVGVSLITATTQGEMDDETRQAVEDSVKVCMKQAVSSRKVRRVIAKHLGALPGCDPKTVLEELYEIKAALEPEP